MWGKMILAMNMLCLLAFYVRGEHACLRVIGVKSPFVAVGTPELENSETFLRSADSTVVGIEIHEADAHRLYCLGVNNKVCFFSLSPGGNVTVGRIPVFRGWRKEKRTAGGFVAEGVI